MPLPRRRLALGSIAGLWLVLAALPALRFAGRAVDDVYITYRYAQNLAAGHGYVFNRGERVFGVTEPAVGLLLGGLAWLTGAPIPALGTLFTALALLGLALGLLSEAAARERPLEGALAGTLLVATPLLWQTQGAAGPAVLLLLLAGARLAPNRPILAGVVCGLAVAFRPDALVGCAIVVALLLVETRRLPWRFAIAAGTTAAALALVAYGWFGAWIPQTLLAKQYHAARNPGSWIGFEAFWGRGLQGLGAGPAGRLVPWTLLLGFAGTLANLRRATRAERVLALYGVAMALVYPLLRVPFFAWYAIPPLVAALWGLAQAAGAAARAATARRGVGRWAAVLAAAAVAVLVVAWAIDFGAYLRGRRPDWRTVVYREAGAWLREHAAPEADLAFHEVGMVAFSSQRRVEDLLGLVTPRSLPYAREGDVVGAFLAKPTAYFLAHPFADGGAMRAVTTRPWFRDGYREAARFDHPELGGWIAVFERRPDAVLPPPRPPRPAARLPGSGPLD